MFKQVDGTTSVLSAAAFVEMKYSPAVLLEASLGADITDDAEFRKACEWGFDAYFEEMYHWNASHTDLEFLETCYTWSEVVEFVIEVVLGEYQELAVMPSRCWRAGFVLGWLSALALVNRFDAVRAVTLLRALIVPSERTLEA